jgi:hypothetical protein
MRNRFDYYHDKKDIELEYKGRIVMITYEEYGRYDQRISDIRDPACESSGDVKITSISWQTYNVGSQGLHDVEFEVEYKDRNWNRLMKWCPKFVEAIYDKIF